VLVFLISVLFYKFARTIGLPHHFGMLMRWAMRSARQMSPKLSWGKCTGSCQFGARCFIYKSVSSINLYGYPPAVELGTRPGPAVTKIRYIPVGLRKTRWFTSFFFVVYPFNSFKIHSHEVSLVFGSAGSCRGVYTHRGCDSLIYYSIWAPAPKSRSTHTSTHIQLYSAKPHRCCITACITEHSVTQ
jgi:hypothetical protein